VIATSNRGIWTAPRLQSVAGKEYGGLRRTGVVAEVNFLVN